MKSHTPVLLVEDSAEDLDLARRAWRRCGLLAPLVVAEDGRKAWQWLSGEARPSEYSDRAERIFEPSLILLDLKLPGLDGRELLTRLKSDPRLATTPVVVLTTSSHPSDVEYCYRLGAAGYHRKSNDLRQYEATINTIADYWLRGSAVLPCGPSALGKAEQLTINIAGGTDGSHATSHLALCQPTQLPELPPKLSPENALEELLEIIRGGLLA